MGNTLPEPLMSRILIAAIALSFSVGAADAATKHKRKHVRHAPAAAYLPALPYPAYRARPPWAAPHQCFTDEGYGRFRPCDAGPMTW
jgi:hypothetical protein